MQPNSRNAGVQLWLNTTTSVPVLRNANTLSGVVVLSAAANNGPGAGTLIAANGTLAWQAPQSGTPGPAQGVPAEGTYALEDGEDPSCWITVQVYPDYLPAAGAATVDLTDLYNSGIATDDDVSAANASAGIVETIELRLKNVTVNPVTNLLIWLDSTASGFSALSISLDGVHYYQPTSATDPNVLLRDTLNAGSSAFLWVKRTITAGAASSPAVLNWLHWQWDGIG